MSDEKTCFVVSPLGDEESETREDADEVLEYIIEPVLEDFDYSVTRSDKMSKSGRITVQVFDAIATSDLVIGDLTGLNPNVMYEMGVRLSLGSPFIQLAEKGQELPFDTSDFRTIFYQTDDLGAAEDAKDQLREQVQKIENEGDEWDHGIPVDALSKGKKAGKGASPDENRKLLMLIKSTLSDISESIEETNEFAFWAASNSKELLDRKEVEREARREEQMMSMMGEIMGNAMQNPEALKALSEFDQNDGGKPESNNDGPDGLEEAMEEMQDAITGGDSDE